jgi:hypothetical protein
MSETPNTSIKILLCFMKKNYKFFKKVVILNTMIKYLLTDTNHLLKRFKL